ncbi:MAG: Uma2 family endonuclease [Acidobacteriota bacterium]
MATTSTHATTFAEFEQLPDTREGKYELRHGELVLIAPPKHGHQRIQYFLQRRLGATSGTAWLAVIEIGFRPGNEHEYWIADVALVSAERWNRTNPEGYFEGAPEVVIEILCPSNTTAEMLDRRDTCLKNGAQEFWLVDPIRHGVEVSTPDGHSMTYPAGQQIPLLVGGVLAVDEIFV